jgi:hypothetical protein
LSGSCKSRQFALSPFKKPLPKEPAAIEEIIRSNNSQYNGLVIGHFKVRYSSPENSATFYGAAKIDRDSLILVSLRAPLGIELSRVLLTPDSMKMINRSDNKVIISGYNYLHQMLHVGLNFNIIESLIAGNLPAQYKLDSRMSQQENEFSKSTTEKFYMGSYYNQNAREGLKFEAWANGKVRKVSYMKFFQKRNVKLFDAHISDYINVTGNYYPKEILITHKNSQGLKTTIKVTFNKFEEIEAPNIRFDVPSKYELIRFP